MTATNKVDCKVCVYTRELYGVPFRVVAEPVNDSSGQVWIEYGPEDDPEHGGRFSAEIEGLISGYFDGQEPEEKWWHRVLEAIFGFTGPRSFKEAVDYKINQLDDYVRSKLWQEHKQEIGCIRIMKELKEYETK